MEVGRSSRLTPTVFNPTHYKLVGWICFLKATGRNTGEAGVAGTRCAPMVLAPVSSADSRFPRFDKAGFPSRASLCFAGLGGWGLCGRDRVGFQFAIVSGRCGTVAVL